MISNKREDILRHESHFYIHNRPDWVIGKIPDLSDYRKLSVDSMEEAMKLAQIGQQVSSTVIPSIHGKKNRLYFTQALIEGAATLTRPMAQKWGLDYEKYRSVLMITPSRYGKSFLNAQAVIARAGANGDEVQIGGATRDKASIIQSKVVEMLPYAMPAIQEGLIISDDSKEDKLKKIKRLATQVSKESLKWTNGGSINLFSTNEAQKNAQVAAAGAIGIGGDYAVFDEVQIMSPVGFRTASRFMAEGPDTKRFCVANPMINGHLKELYDDPSTFVVHMNDVTAIIEQRMTRKGFELTGMPVYSQEYRAFVETEFPDEKAGTRFFPTLPEVWDAAKLPVPQRKYYFIGLDSAYQGSDAMLLSIMSMNQAEGKTWFVIEEQINLKERFTTWTDTTTLEIALDVMKYWEKYDVIAGCLDIGFGIHIYEKLKELNPGLPIEPINFSAKPTEWRVEDDYNAKFAANKRAELHLDFRDLCSSNMMYICPARYDELNRQAQEVGQSPAKQKIQIESKKDIKARLGRSPDNLDSACLAVHAMVLSGILEALSEGGASQLMEVY